MKPLRILKHLLVPHWLVKKDFPESTLKAIEHAVASSEKHHLGEIRFLIEGGLPIQDIWQDKPRERAERLFAELRVWDTEHNSGILIYIQWVDRAVEILADRGIAARVPQAEWDSICRGMEAAFKGGDFKGGALAAIHRASKLLETHFPNNGGGPNELPDKPMVI